MTILAKRSEWRIARPSNETRHSSDLTPVEQANAQAALRFLAKRHGTLANLTEVMRSKYGTVKLAMRGRVSAGIALRTARVAGVPLEDVLSGAWPKAGACPHCGRA
jgi:hypothetical protein